MAGTKEVGALAQSHLEIFVLLVLVGYFCHVSIYYEDVSCNNPPSPLPPHLLNNELNN